MFTSLFFKSFPEYPAGDAHWKTYTFIFICPLFSSHSSQQDSEKKKNHTDASHEWHAPQTQPHLCTNLQTYVDTQTLACFSQPAHTHAQIHSPEQIKAYPPTVVVGPQDDEGLDPKYQLISTDQWLTSQPARARLTNTTQLKAQPKAALQAACWILYQSNDSPQKPLSVRFFSLLLSLGLCHCFFLLLLSLPQTIFLPVSMKERRSVLGMKAKHIKEQYFWRSRGWILTFCNETMIPNASKVLWNVWNQEWSWHSPKLYRFSSDIKIPQTFLVKGNCCWSTKCKLHKLPEQMNGFRKWRGNHVQQNVFLCVFICFLKC